MQSWRAAAAAERRIGAIQETGRQPHVCAEYRTPGRHRSFGTPMTTSDPQASTWRSTFNDSRKRATLPVPFVRAPSLYVIPRRLARGGECRLSILFPWQPREWRIADGAKDAPSKISVIVSEQSARNEDVCQHEIASFFEGSCEPPR